MQPWRILQVLILLALANGAPVIAKKLLNGRLAWPIDGGLRLPDGHPLFGPSKTIRGLVVALAAASFGAALLGFDWRIGLFVGALAMAGDLASSFVKRRLGRGPSTRALGLDQIPEALLPLLAGKDLLLLGWWDIAAGVVLFFFGELLLSRLLYKAHIRDQPY